MKNLGGILAAIQSAQAPEKFSNSFLSSLEYKSSSDRLVIGVLKSVGFLDDAGKPTERYFRYLDQTQSKKVLAEGVREAYRDLFQINVKANTLSKSDLVNKFKTLSQGKISDSVLDKMAMTFTNLVKHADFSGDAPPEKESYGSSDVNDASSPSTGNPSDTLPGLGAIGGLVYNIQLVLPESRDPAVYDAFFDALRRHLR